MQMSQLDAHTYVGPQISVADLADIAALGVRTIIVARPEGEEIGQPKISDIREAADAFGIRVHHIPVISGNMTDDDVSAFDAATTGTTHPVLAYCRSGMRAASLWALSAAAKGRSRHSILLAARNANYDLSNLSPRLVASAA